MKKGIKLWYSDFYEGFDPSDNYLQEILSQTYNIQLEPRDPDYLIFSCYGWDFLNYKRSLKIYYTGENLVPDFNLCDYAIGFHYLQFEDRYIRYPNYAFIEDQFRQLITPKKITIQDLQKKEFFCNFIYANSNADPARDEFFHDLSNYKPVTSPGSHLNNASFPVGKRFSDDWMYTKLGFQEKCKFTIAFENSSSPGYTTEKLMHAFISNTIPIYWGNPDVTKEFNPKAFINCHDFNSFDQVIRRVMEIDKNEELTLQMMNEPAFQDNKTPPTLKKQRLEEFLKSIFDQKLENAYRRPKFGTTIKYEDNLYQTFKIKKKLEAFSPFRKVFRL